MSEQINLGAPTLDEEILAANIGHRLWRIKMLLDRCIANRNERGFVQGVKNEVLEEIMRFNRDVGERKG